MSKDIKNKRKLVIKSSKKIIKSEKEFDNVGDRVVIMEEEIREDRIEHKYV